MEIHFYEAEFNYPKNVIIWNTWTATAFAIKIKEAQIYTTQMGLLSTTLFNQGYRIFVHPDNGKSYEIKLGTNDCTNREIKMEHNLFNLWKAGEFFAV